MPRQYQEPVSIVHTLPPCNIPYLLTLFSEILLLLTYPSQILYYDLEGTYLSSYPLDDMYQSFAVDKGFIYLRNDTYANGVVSDYSLIVINKETGKQTSLLEPLLRNSTVLFFW